MLKRKVILVEEVNFLRNALKNTLLSIGNVEIVAELSNGNELLDLLETKKSDITFIDIKQPTNLGIEITKKAILKNPEMAVIAYSSLDIKCYIDQFIAAGVKGYLSNNKNNYNVLREIIKNPQRGHFFSE